MSKMLTHHFSWAEATRSLTATRLKLDNTPPDSLILNIQRMATVMERVRAIVGTPIKVNSWYRSPAVNKAVGGSPTSAHLKGLAVDWEPVGVPLLVAFEMIKNSNMIFDQLIHEGTKDGADWIHLGLTNSVPRNEVLMARGDKLGGRMSFTRVARG